MIDSFVAMEATTLAALGEPSRLRIVEHLRRGPSAVGELAESLSIRQPQVSKHLRVLSDAGVVECTPISRRRIYHLRSEPFEDLEQWLGSFERLWADRLDSLGDYLASVADDRRP